MSEQSLARRRPPKLFTLYSGDVRIDVLVAAPEVMHIARYVRQAFERVRPPRALDAEHLAMRYPYRVRLSWASDPERVLAMERGAFLLEDFSVPESAPTDRVFDVAQQAIDEWIQKDQRGRTKLANYDPLAQSADLSWEPPAAHHKLAGARRRLPGQAVPPAVLLRIRLLLSQAERSDGFEAESAYARAGQLAQSYGVDMQTLQNASRRDPAVHANARKMTSRKRRRPRPEGVRRK